MLVPRNHSHDLRRRIMTLSEKDIKFLARIGIHAEDDGHVYVNDGDRCYYEIVHIDIDQPLRAILYGGIPLQALVVDVEDIAVPTRVWYPGKSNVGREIYDKK
jgi:hypothetical protein